MKLELQNLADANTWDIVPRPNNANVVSSRQVLKVMHVPGCALLFKARFVACGFSQVLVKII
jgi:hypothetical protein